MTCSNTPDILLTMNPIKRSDAQAAGLTQYFTGKPCIHGHNAPRYTSSGTCADCVAAARDAGRGRAPSVPTQPRGRILAPDPIPPEVLRGFKTSYILIKLRVLTSQRPQLAELMEAYNFARWPELPLDYHELGRPLKHESGTIVFEVRCHPDDEEALRAECGRLLAHAPRVAPPDWIQLAKDHGLDAQDAADWPQGDPR